MEFKYRLKNIDELVKKIKPFLKNKLILIEGGLGSGKTTLIKKICKELGYNNHVTSPTFPILNIYENKPDKIYHADFYRLNNINEVNELGIYEIMDKGDWFFIEWPELLLNKVDSPYTKIEIITLDKDTRKINLTNHEF